MSDIRLISPGKNIKLDGAVCTKTVHSAPSPYLEISKCLSEFSPQERAQALINLGISEYIQNLGEELIKNIDISELIKELIPKYQILTEDEYDSLDNYDEDTIYFVKE